MNELFVLVIGIFQFLIEFNLIEWKSKEIDLNFILNFIKFELNWIELLFSFIKFPLNWIELNEKENNWFEDYSDFHLIKLKWNIFKSKLITCYY